MGGLGTLINTAGILLGGMAGGLTQKLFRKTQQESLTKACGIAVMFLAVAGAMEGMLGIEGNTIVSGKAMFIVLCIALGTVIGELLDIEAAFERFGEWLKKKSGNSGDAGFTDAFVSASLTVCIGAMAIVGSIQDGILHDPSTLSVKAVLDFIIIAVMTSSMGKGCIFSAIPVFLFQGSITLFAQILSPLMTAQAVANLSLVGSILIFCVGVNLVFGRTIRTANLLPAVLLAVFAAYLPFF